MNILCMESLDPCLNLATEEYLLSHSAGDLLLFWRNDRTVVLGRHQNAMEEVDLERARRLGITVVRRNTGGGCVYHDLGNLNYSLITDVADEANLSIEHFARPVAEALRSLGVPAVLSGRNDILADGKKISGCAQFIEGNRFLHHGTLLFSSHLEDMTGLLRVQPDKFLSKSTKSVRSRVGNISDFLPDRQMDVLEFRDYLVSRLGGEGQTLALTAAQQQEIQAIAETKYRSWEWTYGEAPAFQFTNRRRFSGGSVEAGVSIEDGRICDITLRGDFMARRSVAEIEQALRGCPLRQDALTARLENFMLEEYFGSITAQELTQCLLSVCTEQGDLSLKDFEIERGEGIQL